MRGHRIQDIPESTPVVIVTGSADRHACFEEVTAMYRRIQSHARLVVFDGAQHVNLDQADPKLYSATLLNFLDSTRTYASAGPASATLPALSATPLRG